VKGGGGVFFFPRGSDWCLKGKKGTQRQVERANWGGRKEVEPGFRGQTGVKCRFRVTSEGEGAPSCLEGRAVKKGPVTSSGTEKSVGGGEWGYVDGEDTLAAWGGEGQSS